MNYAVDIGFGWHDINTKFREVVRKDIHADTHTHKHIAK
jgi:hypothetical protein